MRSGSVLLVVALVALASCASEAADPGTDEPAGGTAPPLPPVPDGGFGDGLEGEDCAAPSDCSEGLFCLAVGAPAADDPGLRCVVGCNVASHCAGRTCFARFGASETDEPRGFCAAQAGLGAPCDPDALVYCAAADVSLVCYPGGTDVSRCYELCDPSAGGACSVAGESCADFFGEPDVGLCVVPSPDRTCDLATRFCGPGESCTVAVAGEPGRCFARCDPQAEDPGCGEGLSCAEAFAGTTDQGICVDTQDTNTPCNPAEYRFCAAPDICVDEGEGRLVCRRECTGDATVCEAFAAERTCRALPEDEAGRSICSP